MPEELTAEQATVRLKIDDTLGMPLGPGQPPAFLRALGERAVITTPRHQVDVIVTEYGAAELEGKTVQERGEALAAIAHPQFRDELLAAAERASKGRSPVA
jgi:acyl-CoA hydrolase